jgi:hypothetical protein
MVRVGPGLSSVRFLRQGRDPVILLQKLELDPGKNRPYPPSGKRSSVPFIRCTHPYDGSGTGRKLGSYLLAQC